MKHLQKANTSSAYSLLKLPNNQLAFGSIKNIFIFETLTYTLTKTLLAQTSEKWWFDNTINATTLLNDGKYLVSGGGPLVKVWSLPSFELIQTLDVHTDKVSSLVTLKDNRVVSGSKDKSLIIWKFSATTKKPNSNSDHPDVKEKENKIITPESYYSNWIVYV